MPASRAVAGPAQRGEACAGPARACALLRQHKLRPYSLPARPMTNFPRMGRFWLPVHQLATFAGAADTYATAPTVRFLDTLRLPAAYVVRLISWSTSHFPDGWVALHTVR